MSIKQETGSDAQILANIKVEIEIDIKQEVVDEPEPIDEPEEYAKEYDVPIVDVCYVPKNKTTNNLKFPTPILPKPLTVIKKEPPKPSPKRARNKNKGKYCCDYCSKYFATKGTIKHHIRSHTGEKPYKCTNCNKSYFNRISLNDHMRIHTGERPFMCRYCQRTFIRKKSALMHERIHTDEKPYQCQKCDRKFNHLSNMTRHNCELSRKKKPHKCPYCPKNFGYKKSLTYHLNVHTCEFNYCCKDCGRVYSLKCSFQKHKCPKRDKETKPNQQAVKNEIKTQENEISIPKIKVEIEYE